MTSLVAPAQKETLDTVDNGKNSVCADIPKTIETFSANSHETEWYGVQTQAWQKVVDENPRNEWAWRNLFRAPYQA